METPKNVPERSLEATMRLHEVFSQISQVMTEKGETFFNGEFDTGLTHEKIFPEAVCDGTMCITYMDNLVEYADLICKNGCKETHMVHMVSTPSIEWEQEGDFMIQFEELGFVSASFKVADDGVSRFINLEHIIQQIDTKGLTDDDLADLV